MRHWCTESVSHIHICDAEYYVIHNISCIYAVIVTPAASHDSVHYISIFVCSSEVNRSVLETQAYSACLPSLSPPIYQLLTWQHLSQGYQGQHGSAEKWSVWCLQTCRRVPCTDLQLSATCALSLIQHAPPSSLMRHSWTSPFLIYSGFTLHMENQKPVPLKLSAKNKKNCSGSWGGWAVRDLSWGTRVCLSEYAWAYVCTSSSHLSIHFSSAHLLCHFQWL